MSRDAIRAPLRAVGALLGAGLLAACDDGPTEPVVVWDASRLDAEVPRAWFDMAYELTASEGLSPPVASRAFGYEGVALYEAVVSGAPGHRSLAGQLNGLADVPEPSAPALHWPTAANAALATVFPAMYPTQESRQRIAGLESTFSNRFRAELSPTIFDRSVEHGQAVGAAILEWAGGDGYDVLGRCPFSPPVGSGLWEPTPPGYAPALEPCWGQMRPFVLPDGDACAPGPPPPYSEQPGSAFHDEAMEVYRTVQGLTPAQDTIARFWSDDPGATGTPPGHSISIAGQVLGQEDASLTMAAETYAKVGIAVADAFVACWWTKFRYNLIRPITYVRRMIDPAWTIPLLTPPFPEYTSGHSVQSGAAAQVLADLFGDLAFTDHTHDDRGFVPRPFDSFLEAADEAAISRLYGGIHYRAAIELGVEQGRCVGNAVSALRFRQ